MGLTFFACSNSMLTTTARSGYGAIVMVSVGTIRDGKSMFHVHRDLLYHYASAVKDLPVERFPPETQPANPNPNPDMRLVSSLGTLLALPNHQPKIFQLYVRWLYAPDEDLDRVIDTKEVLHTRGAVKAVLESQKSRPTYDLIRLWILADCLGDIRCKIAVIDSLSAAVSAGTVLVHAGHVYTVSKEAGSASDLRKCVVDGYMEKATIAILDEDKDTLPKGFEGIALRRMMLKEMAA